LWLWRDVRTEESCGVGRHAHGQGQRRPRHGRLDMYGRRLLLPTAHRRRTLAPGRSRPHRPLSTDPGLHPGGGVHVTFLGLPGASPGVGQLRGWEPFPTAATKALRDSQLRTNLARATRTIRAKRAAAVAELDDWPHLRAAGAAIKDDVLSNLDT